MADRLHLPPKHRWALKALLRTHLPDIEVWAYGSRVNGRSHDGSDLDLVLRGPHLKKIPADQLGNFEEAVRESNIPFLVEAHDWARLPERFHREIEREHVVLTKKEESQVDEGWREHLLGDLTDNFDSIRVPVKQAERRTGPYPYYGASGIIDYIDDHLFDGEYLLIAEDGENLRTRNTPIAFLASGKFWVNNHAHIVRGNQKADTRYLMYALSALDVSGYLTGSTMPKLTQGNLERISLFMPPLTEQRTIAHVLGTLDDKIELNRRMNETLEAMVRSLFKSWFVDFDAVQAKMESRDSGLSHPIANLFPDRLVKSDTREIPEGWKLVPLPEIVEINPRRSLERDEPASYLDMASMPTKGHRPDKIVRRPFGSGTRFTNGDTLIARITPCLENGKTAYVDFLQDGETGWGSTEYIVMRPKPPLPNEFAYCLARSDTFREFAIQSMTGTSGRQRVPAAALSQFLFPSPPKQVARGFARLVQPLIVRASEAVRESSSLAALRDTLLPMLISGKLRLTARTDKHSPGP